MSYYNKGMYLIDCQFYIRESAKEITCQDIEEGALSSKKFDSEERKIAYQKAHCRAGCDRCHIAKEIKRLLDA